MIVELELGRGGVKKNKKRRLVPERIFFLRARVWGVANSYEREWSSGEYFIEPGPRASLTTTSREDLLVAAASAVRGVSCVG